MIIAFELNPEQVATLRSVIPPTLAPMSEEQALSTFAYLMVATEIVKIDKHKAKKEAKEKGKG